MLLNTIQNINFGYNPIKRSYGSKIHETRYARDITMSERDAFILKGEAEFAMYNCKNIKKQAQDMTLIAQNAKCNAKELYEEKRELIKSTFDELCKIDFDEDGHYYEKYGEPNGEWQLHKAWNKNLHGVITMKEFDENGKLVKEVECKNSCAITISTIDPKTGKKDVVKGYTNGFFGCEVNKIMMGYQKNKDGYEADEVYTFEPKDTFDKLINFEMGYTKTSFRDKSEVKFDFKDHNRNRSLGFLCEIDASDYNPGTKGGDLTHDARVAFIYGYNGSLCNYLTGVQNSLKQQSASSCKEDYTFDSMGNLRTYETGKAWISGKERISSSKVEFENGKPSIVYKNYIENYEHNVVKSEGKYHF